MIKAFLKRLLATKRCNLCHSAVYKFTPINDNYINNLRNKGFSIPIDRFETLNFSAYTCPFCNATDRDRLIGLYIEKFLLESQQLDILEIAPSTAVRTFLRGKPNVRYRCADLYMEGVDDKVDIQDMHIYKDNTFDVIICSHVLEHVPDDLKAIR